MTQSDEFGKFTLKRIEDDKISENNKLLVYFDNKLIYTLTKEEIVPTSRKVTKEPFQWWEIGKLPNRGKLFIENKQVYFPEKCDKVKEGFSWGNGKPVGNFIVMEFNDSNYMKISELNGTIKLELVNFLAPYPMVEDTFVHTMKIEDI